MSASQRPRHWREVEAAARAAAWRQERIRLGHAVDENGYSLPPVSTDLNAVPGETRSEKNLRRMAEADRLAYPDEWEPQALTGELIRPGVGGQSPLCPAGSDAPDEINPIGVQAAGGGFAGSDDCPIEKGFDDRCLPTQRQVGPLGT